MVRLRNAVTGVIVNVDEALAVAIGPEWVSADTPPEPVKRGPGRPKKIESEK